MPPAPAGATISYGPSLMPEVSAMGARNYSLRSTLQQVRTTLGGWLENRNLCDRWRKILVPYRQVRRRRASVVSATAGAGYFVGKGNLDFARLKPDLGQ